MDTEGAAGSVHEVKDHTIPKPKWSVELVFKTRPKSGACEAARVLVGGMQRHLSGGGFAAVPPR